MGETPTNASSPADASSPPLTSALPLFALLALFGNEAGRALRYPDVGAAVLFPPYALLTAALLVSRRRDWVWYLLVGAAAHFTAHWPQWSLSWVLLADVANIARALVAAILLRRVFGVELRLIGIRALALFAGIAGIVAPAVGATIGAANVVLHDHSVAYWLPWRAWFVSNALTGVTMLPALVLVFANARRGRPQGMARRRIAEAALLAAALAAACVVAFLPSVGGRWPQALPFYAPLPVLIWAALRFGSSGASMALTVVAYAAILAADRGTGPFLASSTDDNVLTLQMFVLLTTLPVLCIAAVDGARQGVVQLHHALLASLHDHVAILDERGVVLDVNRSWRRFASAADGQLLHGAGPGENYFEACRSAAKGGDLMAERALAGLTSVLGRERRRFEMEFDRNGGREAYSINVEALERPDGGAVVTRTDVTARRQAQLVTEEQRRELSHLARAAVLGQLSGALAHELFQPLTAILSNADAARHLLGRAPLDLEELREILGDIASDDRRAAEVIRRLRGLYQRGETNLQNLHAHELVSEVLELAHAELTMRGVTPTVWLDPDLPPVRGDRLQLQHVLLNLVLNGCEAMSSNAATDRALSVTVRTAAGKMHIAVRDHGVGIAPGLLGRLFEPFVTTKPEGLGLGLSISRTIVTAHGGQLWAENNPGRGATMHCLLPLPEPAPELRSSRKEARA